MIKHISAILKSANLDSDEEHRTAYCQLHIAPFTRDLATQISLEMADGLFRLQHNDFVPRLQMAGSVWTAEFPLQKMEFSAAAGLREDLISGVEIRHMHVQRQKKTSEFMLALGVYFHIVDWPVAEKFFERLKGEIHLTFTPMGQKTLPLQIETEDKEEAIGEFANARASKKTKKGPLVKFGRT